MSVFTKYGRKKSLWEYDVKEFCKRAGIYPGSILGKELGALSDGEFQELTSKCHFEDTLISVSSKGFTVDIGTRVVHYDFS